MTYVMHSRYKEFKEISSVHEGTQYFAAMKNDVIDCVVRVNSRGKIKSIYGDVIKDRNLIFESYLM
jgi:hypothetical protein